MSPASPSPKKQKLDLLPSNALASERALSLAAEFGDDLLPEDIKTLWRAERAAARFLPFLAWGLHVDFWRDDMGVSSKRDIIGSSFAWHRKKGTPWAVKKILEDLGVSARVFEWYEIGTEPHTFAVEAQFDYANSEPFFITSQTRDLLIQAIELTKPERSHLAYFTFVPIDEESDPDHRCIHDVCHWSHGYLWTKELGTELADGSGRLLSRTVDGGAKRRIFGSAAYEWTALYGSHRFDDLPRAPIESGMHLYIVHVVDRNAGGIHRWHENRTWECGGTWEEDCHSREIIDEVLSFARSTARFGGDESMGSINCCFSGGVESVVPDIGTYGAEEFSGRALDGARFISILMFTENVEIRGIPLGFFIEKIEEASIWES